MIDIKSRWSSVVDREEWATRGSSFVAKVKATKVVWFPPEPEKTGKKAAATSRRTAKRTTATAKKATGPAKKAGRPAKKASRPAKSTTSRA